MEILRRRAARRPEHEVYTFLDERGEREVGRLCFGELDRQARAVAARLQERRMQGERVLLLYPPGIEFFAGFFGCLYAGALAVPVFPPDPARPTRTLPRLQAIVADAGASAVLSTSGILGLREHLFASAPDLDALQWLATDELPSGLESAWAETRPSTEDVALLQYTSGSTGAPKGVVVSHGNILHNASLLVGTFRVGSEDTWVSWLPTYHDMGLIGGTITPMYVGSRVVLMSPLDFLRRPSAWLAAISRYRARVSGGPNFAYDLCVRKTTPEQRSELDLGCWSVAACGSEPVRPDTLDRFVEAFGPSGFRREALQPCYGLAEATLVVSCGRAEPHPPSLSLDAGGRRSVGAPEESGRDAPTLVGSGRPLQQVLVVDPESRLPCAEGELGELWVAGPSVAAGYWNRPEESARVFEAKLADGRAGSFLRTGDLALQREGQLFVAGRCKDLIVIRGVNHFPQDVERAVEGAHPALRPGCGAAFSVEEEDQEKLVVVHEVDTGRPFDAAEVFRSVRRALFRASELHPHRIVLIEPRSLPKTSSGKTRRSACREELLSGALSVVAQSPDAARAPAQVASDRDTVGLGGSDPGSPPSAPLCGELLAVEPASRRLSALVSHLCEVVAELVEADAAEVDPRHPLGDIGLDSLAQVALKERLEDELGIHVPVAWLFAHPTLEDLAQALAEAAGVPLGLPAPDAAGLTESGRPLAAIPRADLVEQIRELSDEEAHRLLASGG